MPDILGIVLLLANKAPVRFLLDRRVFYSVLLLPTKKNPLQNPKDVGLCDEFVSPTRNLDSYKAPGSAALFFPALP